MEHKVTLVPEGGSMMVPGGGVLSGCGVTKNKDANCQLFQSPMPSRKHFSLFWVLTPCGVMEASRPSETLVTYRNTTRRYNPEHLHLNIHRRGNLKSLFISRVPSHRMLNFLENQHSAVHSVKYSQILAHSMLITKFLAGDHHAILSWITLVFKTISTKST
jgi:hypothetical protein